MRLHRFRAIGPRRITDCRFSTCTAYHSSPWAPDCGTIFRGARAAQRWAAHRFGDICCRGTRSGDPVGLDLPYRLVPARGCRALRRNRLESADGGASSELPRGVVGHRSGHNPAGGGKRQRPYRKNEERNNDLDKRVAGDPLSSLHSARILPGLQEILTKRRPQSAKSRALHGQ